MAKVYGMHMISLRPGVSKEEFERVMVEELPKYPMSDGWKAYLLKGDRGDRDGRYMLMFEVESVEARDRYIPAPDSPSEESEQFFEKHKEAAERFVETWNRFSTSIPGENTIYTDYVVFAES